MDFFESLIEETRKLLSKLVKKEYPLCSPWEDVGRNTLVLKRDEAFELDGTGFNLVTSNPIGESGVTVIGSDLKDIKSERRFARISLIQTVEFEDEQSAYNAIRKVEYSKYHYFPEGFMLRTVSTSHKEAARVTKKALEKGISFQKVGSLLASKYLENENVVAARIFYVTDSSADFDSLEKIAERNYEITEALNHIMKDLPLDCSACRLKPICDEVEGMRELHFSKY